MFVNKHSGYLKCAYLKKVKGVIMRNLRGTFFYMKTNVLQDFHICISAPLIPIEKTVYAPVYSLFEILGNENFFKQFVANSLCYLTVRRVIRREGFTVNIYIEVVLINGAK